MRSTVILALITLFAAVGCAPSAQFPERCYLGFTDYREAKAQFEEAGSFAMAEQYIQNRQWTDCERHQFRYQLRYDLGIEELAAQLEEE